MDDQKLMMDLSQSPSPGREKGSSSQNKVVYSAAVYFF